MPQLWYLLYPGTKQKRKVIGIDRLSMFLDPVHRNLEGKYIYKAYGTADKGNFTGAAVAIKLIKFSENRSDQQCGQMPLRTGCSV